MAVAGVLLLNPASVSDAVGGSSPIIKHISISSLAAHYITCDRTAAVTCGGWRESRRSRTRQRFPFTPVFSRPTVTQISQAPASWFFFF